MGQILQDVLDRHLRDRPEEMDLLKPFLSGFTVTWARRRKAYGTVLSVYLLKPEGFITETYGFEREILMVYSHYQKLEPRAIQAAESFLHDDPGKHRAEKLNYFLISEDKDVEEWLRSYTSVRQESRIIIGFFAQELRDCSGDSWFVRNVLNEQLYSRDLFDYRLPLQEDTYFFGRTDIIKNFSDAVKRSENRGLFGLRKTGKTSLLYKLERMINAEGSAHFIYYDCKLNFIRGLRWYELLDLICHDISDATGVQIKGKRDEIHVASTFVKLVTRLTKPVVVVFDEVEWISPFATEDPHWEKDFVNLWQTFWACQSRHRKISAVFAGVNPSMVEVDIVNGVQNPLFGIVSYQFLTGLDYEDMRNMIYLLGKRMGLRFSHQAMEYMHKRYGGHPLLTRMACSWISNNVANNRWKRPFDVDKTYLLAQEDNRDSDLVFYCRHVVSELRQFYPDEYEMLEFLASGQINDFVELAAYPEYIKHLESYGLLEYNSYRFPTISIPVIGRYIGLELAREEGRKTIYKVVVPDYREEWVKKRISSILKDMRFLEKLLQNIGFTLFGPNSFPEADTLLGIHPCVTEGDFESFINTMNRCFVESIDNYGKSIGKKNYFWHEVKNSCLGLWRALHRIRVYRNNHMHLKLNPNVNNQLLEFLQVDLEGKNPSQVSDLFFVLQQCTLDGLLTGIQVEVNKLSV